MSIFRTKNLDAMIAASAKPGGLKKVLGPTDLILLGIGAIVGTGIFVLTGTGAVTAGPGLSLSFVIAAMACCFAALCYAEFASTVPVAGSIYTYSYATLGEFVAWMIGWDLLLEYGLATSTVAVGWSGYFQSLLSGFGLVLPDALTAAPGARPGVETLFNLPAFLIMMAITFLLSLGMRESARLNNVMVIIKISVVLLFIAVGVGHVKPENWQPYMPYGMTGVMSAAALVFFAFIGFDAVTSAAEEVKNPARDLPIGIIGSLIICTILYVVVAAIMTGIVPHMDFKGVDHPVSLALQVAGEDWVAGFVDLAAILGMSTV
ncbi:MAG: amino acid permease, partial [Oxalobacteraceae bacterium]